MTYINPRQKPLAHLDRIVGWQRGEKPAPVTIEWDLSNRCTYGCSACLTDGAQVIVRGVGPVSIAGVMLGHEVLAFDESTGAVRWTQVRATSVRYAHEHIVRVESAGRVIEATREHPFYTKHGWTNAESINTGSEVLHAHCGRDCWGETVSGDRAELRVDLAWAVVDRVSTERRIVAVYNLETEAGTYLADGIVVHNCHFAHTHTRGPLTRTARVLPMAHDRGGDLADTDLVLRALMEARIAGVKSIVWTGGGEPTTHPDWHFLMSTAWGMGFEQGLYTMGSLISTTQAATIRQWLSWVVVSLDHPDAETYAREKRIVPAMFDRACETVRALGHGKAAIGVSFLLHAGNYTQAQDMLALSRSLGATYTTFRPLVETAPSEPGVLLGDRAWVRVATPGLQALAAQPDVELDVDRFHEWAGWSGHGYTVCQGPALNTTITPDGRLWVCPNRREYAGSCLGDLRVESFADIWARHPGRFPVTADCRAQCRLHHVNQALDALAQPREHANFI